MGLLLLFWRVPVSADCVLFSWFVLHLSRGAPWPGLLWRVWVLHRHNITGETLLLVINFVAPGTEVGAGKQGIQTEVTQRCFLEALSREELETQRPGLLAEAGPLCAPCSVCKKPGEIASFVEMFVNIIGSYYPSLVNVCWAHLAFEPRTQSEIYTPGSLSSMLSCLHALVKEEKSIHFSISLTAA